jgi:acyl-CoA synthetase (NDP forming)
MPSDAVALSDAFVATARREGRSALLETEGFQLLEAVGLRVPRRLFLPRGAEITSTGPPLTTAQVVVKVVSPDVLHKSERGGIAVVANTTRTITEAVETMAARFPSEDVRGFSIAELVPYEPSFGSEWLFGLRWTNEFGPVVSVGAGGIGTEFLAAALLPGREAAAFSPSQLSREHLARDLARLAVTPFATGGVRQQPPRTSLDALVLAVQRFGRLAYLCRPDGLLEIEANPIVASAEGLVALDVLATLGTGAPAQPLPRPLSKIHQLLEPRSIAVMGVSATQLNPGRIILQNLLREAADPAAICVVKPGETEIDGCRAVAGVRALPHPVDLLVLSVSAAQVPEALIEVCEEQKAESVIVIPGGFDEKAGSSGLVEQMLAALAAARQTPWGGPVVNGGNCLGITSRPGNYDTMFIPAHKLGRRAGGPEAPLAIVSQSGAFAVSRETRLSQIRPRYSITVGNQMDLTIGDYLTFLEADPGVELFAVYLEGFRPLDGLAAVEAIERITASGRSVLLYRAGRTPEGRLATASHTAVVAGHYAVSRDLLRRAGAVVAETLEDFTDLVMLFSLLHDRPVAGRRVGALSNAGYECVAIADSAGALRLEPFTARTRSHLDTLLERHRLGTIVDVHNPLDVTPMLGDEGFAEAAQAIVEDPEVDVGVFGCVPATPALTTLAPGASHKEDVGAAGGLAGRLIALKQVTAKPFVVVVDAGPLYDPFASRLLDGGIPTFRSADRALRLLNAFVEERYADAVRAESERWIDEFSVT